MHNQMLVSLATEGPAAVHAATGLTAWGWLLVALPLALVLAVAAAWWGARQARQRWGRVAAGGALVALLAATAVPTGLATWPHHDERVEAGGLAAAEAYCDAFEPGDVVLAVDDWAVNHWTQVTRGMCGVPSVATTGRLRDDPEQVLAAARRLDVPEDPRPRLLRLRSRLRRGPGRRRHRRARAGHP